MSDLERKLLSIMTTPDGMAVVAGSGLREEVFEEPINRHVFAWMIQYWVDSDKQLAPTWLVMETEFPAVTPKLMEARPVAESVEWLVGDLNRRYLWGRIQEIALKAAETGHEDPTGALETLWRDGKDAWARSAKTGGSLLDRLGINGAELDAKHFEALQYAVPDIIPEGLGIMGGPPKLGKSWVAIDVGLAVSGGGLAFGSIPCAQRPVLYLALEDGERRLQERSRAAMAGKPIPDGITFITTATPTEALEVIAEFMARHQEAKPLVLLDTLGKVKRPKKSGEDSYLADYQEVGGRFKALTDSTPGATLLLVHHSRKAVSDDFVETLSGTFGITGAVDFVIKLTRKRLSNEALLNVTGRDVIEAEYALHVERGLWRLKGTDLDAARSAAEEQRDSSSMGATKSAVLRFVRLWPHRHSLRASDVTRALSISQDTAGTNLRRLADEGLIAKVGYGQYLPITANEMETQGEGHQPDTSKASEVESASVPSSTE